ncbi:hypothetical protein MROS_1094 [Melioribacter roseus P3M-2]|uniref:Uncharacterized protein n=1 Tax=Melioribacter roseus (strain DSM 23840 / JCM 17771 / VKM B-2668 / P3M-2) TaxID=1191523 RepID=I6ZZ97_MELRP|nr:hypothetical protein [Melioribacter roseus]AFN74333.1 hypothetical protein MROS_1094 [Melioribacter roseus P3M-2]
MKKEYKFEKGTQFTVIQPSITKNRLEIRLQEETVALLKATNIFKNDVLLEGDWGEWEFYRESIWKSDIAIRPYGLELPTAFFDKEFFNSGGTLKLPMGFRFYIQMHPFKKYHELLYGNERLILYKQKSSIKKKKLEIIIEKENDKLNKNAWVAAFPVYLIQASRNNF